MSSGYDDAVERLYERLTDALERVRPRPYESPVTVAEIYQELVPYRSVRSEVGFGMNADYEDALLRLLAGEHDLARLEPDHARDEIRRELAGVNPNVSIYRAYAGCDVWLRPRERRAGEAAPARTQEKPQSARSPDTSAAPHAVAAPPERDRPAPAAAAPAAAVASPREQPEPPAPRRRCSTCSASLPAQRTVRFCPSCGTQQVSVDCGVCGEQVEPGWRYCIGCGSDARRAAQPSA